MLKGKSLYNKIMLIRLNLGDVPIEAILSS